jgi:ABC-type glutathione transport system ATPase component
MANDPPTLIADEPTGNLDSKTAEMVIETFEELVHRGKTVLIVTHDITVARHASHMLILSDGELIDEQVERIFPDLSHKTLLAMTHRLKKLTIRPGQPVHPAGGTSPEAGFMIVEEGGICISRLDGREAGLSENIFGQDALISQDDYLNPHYLLSACGDAPLVAKMIDGADLEAWLKTIPEAQAKLFELRLKDQKLAYLRSGEQGVPL